MSNKFWNFIDEDGERVLRLEGPIDEDNFWGDEITPQKFREELEAEEGNLTVWINSPGGSVFAAASIYTMLCDYKGKVTVKIDAIAASAASVVAMAGDRVLMSPVAMMLVHDPMTIAMGNAQDMQKAITTLEEIKESIINAYVRKTGLSRNKVSRLMSDETWLSAKKAVDLGFADEILFAAKETKEPVEGGEENFKATWQSYSSRAMGQAILNRLIPATESSADVSEEGEITAPATLLESERLTEKPEEAASEAVPETQETEEASYLEDTASEDAPSSEEVAASEDTATAPQEAEAAPQEAAVSEAMEAVEVEAEAEPTIGLDGKAKDGSMPYNLLKAQLEFLQ